MKPTKQKLKMIKEARKIERELQISLGMNFNRHRVHESKKTYNRKNIKKMFVD
jgi:hypothetical protein